MTTGEPQGEPESLERRSQRHQDELAQVEAGSGEQCLLGTNAIIPLGLMTPWAGVEATAAVEGSKAAYSQQEVVMSLVKACR